MDRELLEIKGLFLDFIRQIDDILEDLKRAKRWSVLDMATDNFLISFRKRSHIKRANKKLGALKRQFNDPKLKLYGIDSQDITKLNDTIVDKLLDIVFDNVFTDLIDLKHISNRQRDLIKLKANLYEIIEELERGNSEFVNITQV